MQRCWKLVVAIALTAGSALIGSVPASALILVPDVTLDPQQQTVAPPGTATVTVTVSSSYMGEYQPWANEVVRFTVGGPNMGVVGRCSTSAPGGEENTCLTGADGKVSWSYDGATRGTDSVVATVNVFGGESSLPATVTWGTGGDRDGDGLPDSWEESPGRDLGGGLFDGTLISQGATPDHRDLFVHVDAERGAGLSKKAQKLLTKAYASAPIGNPDGTTGIRFHLINGPTLSAADSDALRSGNEPDWGKIHARYASDLEAHAYHYVVSTNWTGLAWAGMSDDIPGQFVALANCGGRMVSRWFGLGQGPRKSCGMSDDDQAANLMHELGHNLGLHHGGTAPLNNDDLEDPLKPNYLSVMNYAFSHSGIPGLGLTYSNWGPDDLYVLDETSLSETDGVKGHNPLNPVPDGVKTMYFCPGDAKPKSTKVNKAANWNCAKGIQDGRVAANIDYRADLRTLPSWSFLSRQEVLSPSADWGALDFAGGTIGNLGASPPPPGSTAGLIEPDPELLRQIAQSQEAVPAPPQIVIKRKARAGVALSVRIAPETAGTVSCSTVSADGSAAAAVDSANVPAADTTIALSLGEAAISSAGGVVCTLRTTAWVVSSAVHLDGTGAETSAPVTDSGDGVDDSVPTP